MKYNPLQHPSLCLGLHASLSGHRCGLSMHNKLYAEPAKVGDLVQVYFGGGMLIWSRMLKSTWYKNHNAWLNEICLSFVIFSCFAYFQVGSSTWCMHFLTLANASKQVKEDYSQALQVELILMFITTVMLWLTKSSPIVHCIFNIPLLYFTDCCCAFMASTKVCWQVFSSHERHDEFYVCEK